MLYAIKTLLFLAALQLVSIGVFRWSLKTPWRGLVGSAEIALLLLIPVVGLFGQQKLVFYAFVFAGALTALGSADKLVVRFLLLLVCFPALRTTIIVGGFYAGDLDAIDALALGALIVLIGLGRRQARVPLPLMLAAWTIFAATLLLTVRGIPPAAVAREIPSTFLKVMVPFLITARAIGSRTTATNAALAMVWGGLANAVVAIFESTRHWLIYQSFLQLHGNTPQGLSATLSIRAGMLRAHGMVFNYETVSMVTAIALITATACRSRFSAAGYWAVAALLSGGCLASQARSGWILAVVGLVMLALYERRWRMLGLITAVAVPLWLGVKALGAAHARFAQFVGQTGHGDQTLDYRTNLLRRGMQELIAHPLMGQTRAQIDVSMNDMRQSQNIIDFVNVHLNVALVGGVPLLALWLLAFATPLWLIWRKRPRGTIDLTAPALGLPFALIIGCTAYIAGTSMVDRIASLVMIGFGLASSYLRLHGAPSGSSAAERTGRPTRRLLVQPLPV